MSGKRAKDGGLHPEAAEVKAKILTGWVLDDSARAILAEAIEHLSLAMKARELLEAEGLVITRESGMKAEHPAYRILKESTGLFYKGLRLLNLDVEVPGPVGRPPGR